MHHFLIHWVICFGGWLSFRSYTIFFFEKYLNFWCFSICSSFGRQLCQNCGWAGSEHYAIAHYRADLFKFMPKNFLKLFWQCYGSTVQFPVEFMGFDMDRQHWRNPSKCTHYDQNCTSCTLCNNCHSLNRSQFQQSSQNSSWCAKKIAYGKLDKVAISHSNHLNKALKFFDNGDNLRTPTLASCHPNNFSPIY